jgi:hypothetical protein
MITGYRFDYTNQAWTLDGRYIACGHPSCKDTADPHRCYGTVHEGEVAPRLPQTGIPFDTDDAQVSDLTRPGDPAWEGEAEVVPENGGLPDDDPDYYPDRGAD